MAFPASGRSRSEAQRAAERGSKMMRNFRIRRAEQAPFCAMFLRKYPDGR
jgi:hypothetical protein